MTPSWVVRLTIVLFLGWAAILFLSPDGLGATPIHTLYAATGSSRWWLVFLLAVAASCAFFGEQAKPSLTSLLLLMPVQAGIVIVALGAIWAVAGGQYADGVARPWAFIGADQLAYPCIAFFYTRSMLYRHGVRMGWLV